MHVFVRAGIRNKIAWLWGMHLFHFNCSCAVTKLCPTLCNPIDCSTVFPVLHYFLELAQTHVHWVSDAIQPSHPLSPPSLVLNVSQHQGLFQWVVSLHQVAKYWNFSFSPSNEYSGLISFKIDWFYLLAVQGTIKIFTASSPVAYLTSFNLGDSSSSIVSFCFVIMSTRFSRQEYWSGLPFPPPVDPVLSELFTVICQSWVTLHSMAHGFIELCKTLCSNKAVILEGDYNFRL